MLPLLTSRMKRVGLDILIDDRASYHVYTFIPKESVSDAYQKLIQYAEQKPKFNCAVRSKKSIMRIIWIFTLKHMI